MAPQCLPGGFGPLTHRRLPVGSPRGQVDLAEDQVDHAIEELVLVGHVVVERHGFDPEGVAELAHAERRDPTLVGEGDGSKQHSLPAQRDSGLCGRLGLRSHLLPSRSMPLTSLRRKHSYHLHRKLLTSERSMKTATLNRPTDPTTPSFGAGTTSVAQYGLGSPPDDVLREGEIDRLAEANQSIRKASTMAGVGLLAMSLFSALGCLVAVKGLVVPGNAARTAGDITGHEGLFRFGILSLYVVAALDVIVAWALYRVFKPVSDALSRLSAWLRIAYAGVFLVAISQL